MAKGKPSVKKANVTVGGILSFYWDFKHQQVYIIFAPSEFQGISQIVRPGDMNYLAIVPHSELLPAWELANIEFSEIPVNGKRYVKVVADARLLSMRERFNREDVRMRRDKKWQIELSYTNGSSFTLDWQDDETEIIDQVVHTPVKKSNFFETSPLRLA